MASAHSPHGNGGFERQDMGAKEVFVFLIVLALVGLLVYFVVNGMYGFLNRYDQAHQPAVNPLKQNVEIDTRDTNRARVTERIERAFPEPRLETDERTEITGFRLQEEEQLNSYGWVDKSAGTVHIPIERAMQLIAERGLPVRPQAEAYPTPSAHGVAASTRKKAAGATLAKAQ